MKTIKILSTAILAILFAVNITSCSKENDNPPQEEQLKLLEASKGIQEKIEKVILPQGLENHSDNYAQATKAQFYAVKSYSTSLLSFFNAIPANPEMMQASTNPQARSSSEGVTYKWSYAGTTVYYTINELADRYEVKWKIESPEENYVAFDGYFLKDETYAEFNLYDPDNSHTLKFKWWFSEDATKIEFLDTQDNYKIMVESNNHNYAGILKAYENNVLEVEALWNADGSGWYKDYTTGETHTWSAQ